jgi:threonine/homoserine/homoserine lactone efflux protein
MWRARYWAVLGFQVVLLILIIATALGTVQATSATQVIGNALVLAISGTFFYFMIKALARIQMPERLPRE